MSNGKPIKEILPEVIRKLIIQRKHYLKQQRINRHKKNRDPNQPKLPGMKQGGVMAIERPKGAFARKKKKKKEYEGSLDQIIDFLNKNPGYSKEYKTGGRATHGYGKAYLKGGRVK